MSERIINQHYVPRFYLKRFSKRGKLYTYDKVTSKSFPTNIEDVASSKYFYDSDDIDKQTGVAQFVEKHLNPMESKSGAGITELINELDLESFLRLKSSLKETLSNFIAYQFIRTKTFREFSSGMINDVFNQIIEKEFQTEWKNGERYKQSNEDSKKLHLDLILDDANIEKIKSALMEYIWIVCKNNTPVSYYCSDNPVQNIAHSKNFLKGTRGLLSEGIEIAFPISPRYAIHLYEQTHFSKARAFNDRLISINDIEGITYLNYHQVMNCNRQIYSIEDNFTLAKEILCPK